MNKIYFLISKNNVDDLESLLKQEKDVEFPDKDKRTGLIHAVIQNKLPVVQVFLKYNANVDSQDINGYSPLHFASQNYDIEMIETLLNHGATIDLVDKFGNTPLWRAVFNSKGRGEVIKILLKKGANPNLKNLSGVSPYELAQNIANYNLSEFFTE